LNAGLAAHRVAETGENPDVIGLFERLALPVLRAFEPEDAHRLTIAALRRAPLPPAIPADSRLAVCAFGLDFPNPVGVAPGFDKNAEVPGPLLRLGFGFVEIGTVTPRPQTGNPRPRLFRLEADRGIINRLGFNNEGAAAVLERLRARTGGGIVGVNVGANRDSADRAGDYARLVETFAPVASYLTVNVSSPNTPGLRDLQQARALDDLLARAIEARDRAASSAGRRPLLLKIAPDLSLQELDDAVSVARKRGVDGMIVGNTTLGRPPSLKERLKSIEQGGLSGAPLFPLSTRMLAETYVRVEGAFPLIGVGGIDSGKAAVEKIKAGATLVQLYSCLVFRGLSLLDEIKRELLAAIERGRHAGLSPLVGADAAKLTGAPWPE
jgi:dihydroorotate dehydrogenase